MIQLEGIRPVSTLLSYCCVYSVTGFSYPYTVFIIFEAGLIYNLTPVHSMFMIGFNMIPVDLHASVCLVSLVSAFEKYNWKKIGG